MSKKISIIIPTFNRGTYITETLESFSKQDYPDFEIIVCNNRSTDNTAEILEALSKRLKIQVLFEPRQGVHYARNTAAKQATGEILYFTDDDMVATPNLLTELSKAFELDPKVGCATGRVLPRWMQPPPAWVPRLLFNFYLSLNDPPEDLIVSSQDIGIFSCHEAILREVFFKTGGFHPENVAGLWVGDGETGLNQVIKELGYKFAFIGSSVIYHVIPPQRTTQKYLNARLKNQGNCDAYSEIRKNDGKFFIGKEIIRSVFQMLKKSCGCILRSFKDPHQLRFIPATLSYHRAKIGYFMKVRSNSGFRSMVLQKNWLT